MKTHFLFCILFFLSYLTTTAQEYCTAAGRPGTGDDFIKLVRLNSLEKPSGKTAYSDFTDLSTSLLPGNTYTIEVTLFYAFEQDRVYLWIDFNQNGTFEASERTDLPVPAVKFNTTVTSTVTIPTDALPGPTRMRVRSIYNTTNTEPCGNAVFGEVEDYTVNIFCGASGGAFDSHITRVRLNTIDNLTGTSGYSNFSDIQTTLRQGSSYLLRVNVDYAFFDRAFAWMDYNQNGSFEAGERVMNYPFAESLNALAQSTINIPADAPIGFTILRIRFNYNEPSDPCGTQSGEVEDYGIVIGCADTDEDGVCDEEDLCIGYSDPPIALTTDPTTNEEWLAVTTITSTVTIGSGLDVQYKAGSSINLQAGFHAQGGSTFGATIEDCQANTSREGSLADIKTLPGNATISVNEVRPTKRAGEPEVRVFPNPFSGTTTLEYTLSEATAVQVFVTDTRGKRIGKLLADSNRQAAGIHSLQWQCPIEVSGMLLLHLRTSEHVLTRKLIVLRP